MDFFYSSFIHRGCTTHAYQTKSVTDDQVGCELPGAIPDLDNHETKKKKEQIDSYPKSCPPSVQRTLFLNNESPETSAKPNGMDDPVLKEVTYKSMCGMMTKVLFDVLPKALNDVLHKVLPHTLNDILLKVMPTFLEKAMHPNLYNVHVTTSNSANKKDKTEEVDNKDSEAVKPDGHAPKVNECADKKMNLRKLIIRTPRPKNGMNMLPKSMNLKLQLSTKIPEVVEKICLMEEWIQKLEEQSKFSITKAKVLAVNQGYKADHIDGFNLMREYAKKVFPEGKWEEVDPNKAKEVVWPYYE
ncbi:hypothetical protein LWI28_013847 [Acer negundo]|uniref:Uncharacterized protein n=1 Tax=Acer negundo TaxID=4023 RepID=A0AAD5NLQ4_ACENE|nr:hypothetical protein LWI28_013847 [Acer negundo]